VPRQLLRKPVAMLGDESFARDQARAPRQGQSRAALVDRQLEPARSRIAIARARSL